MTTNIGHALRRAAWDLVARQHGVVARWQLLELGFTAEAIRHRLATGRLHPIYPGVYAVGRPQLTKKGHWMAAVLACGRRAVLSHESAAALWELRNQEARLPEVTVPASSRHRRKAIKVHRRHERVFADATTCDGIPVTSPIRTLVDLAPRCSTAEIERLVNQADKLDLISPDALRRGLDRLPGEPGVPALRETLDIRTFVLTDSDLERLFLPIARRVGLPKPRTREYVNGYRVDFYWPDLGLVVETDGLRYHRTPAQQARDRVRDHAHQAAGDEPVRFTHAQVRFDPGYVEDTLAAVVRNLRTRRT